SPKHYCLPICQVPSLPQVSKVPDTSLLNSITRPSIPNIQSCKGSLRPGTNTRINLLDTSRPCQQGNIPPNENLRERESESLSSLKRINRPLIALHPRFIRDHIQAHFKETFPIEKVILRP